ncbi:hypothetical protein [Pseudoalteromonas sp. OF7H-1]|uniref:hypothetical protein n=1 Tax=Pseudoalteromonas sp. OF7H-1 TaxID=2917755 RepID=UPI001EF67A98|nr:hypothetical protein [Pseudoalteromonas sp. OF7H-1]MCG7539036.1 hypothetical protein [Pseudoalteromonas sp. OF7H-1]
MSLDMLKLINSMQAGQAGMYSRHSESLNQLLYNYSPIESALCFSSLLLDPEYQSTTATLEKAIHMSLGVSRGANKATKSYIKKVFNAISANGFSSMEDPAEDVMASKLWLNGKEYKVLLGLWEGCIHQTQMFIDVLESMPNDGDYQVLQSQVEAILVASDQVLTKFNTPINIIGCEYPKKEIRSNSIKDLPSIAKKLNVSNTPNQELLPFLSSSSYQALTTAILGESELEANPFIQYEGNCFLALPTAITTSIRRLIYSFCLERGLLETLTKGLANSISRKVSQLRIFGEFKNAPLRFEKRNNLDNWLVARLSLQFDVGYYFHFIFAMDALIDFDKGWFQGFIGSDDNLTEFISSEIKNFNKYLKEKGNENKSCTIIVPCGFGRGFSVDFSPNNKNELIEVINVNDLATLSQDSDCNPYRIWRLVEAQYLARKYKAHISNLNGFLNLWGYVKQNNFSIFNHSDFVDVDSDSVFISVGTNFQKDTRERVLQDTDLCTISHPELGLVIAQRGYPNSLFEQNDVRQIYCPVDLNLTLLQAAYHKNNTSIWLEMPTESDIDIALQAQFFNAYIHWLPKVIEHLDFVGELQQAINLIRISIDIPKENTRNLPPNVSEEQVLNSCSYSLDNEVLECHFDRDLFYGFSLPTNIAEVALLKPFITKCCKDDEIKTKQVISHVFSSVYARHVHFFECKTYSENIVENFEAEKPITLEIAADNNHKFGLGWINDLKPESNNITGKSDCKAFLGKVVSRIWERTQSKLKTLNKKALITLLLQNIELCQLHKTRWTKSFKANQDLQKNHDDLYQVAIKEIGLLNGASLASRLIIEMAICECPGSGGKSPGKMDVQELQSYALSLHLLGGVSDAINYDAINPKIIISHFGDVLFEHDFEDLIVSKYQHGLHRGRLENSANNYELAFSEKSSEVSENDVENAFDRTFWDAWVSEFGFTPNQAINFIRDIQEYGYTKEQLVFTIGRNELASLPTDLERGTVDKIITALSIESRSNWTDIPKPFKPTDWQPWKFKRLYSLACKPIIYLKNNDTYLISPEHIKRSFFYLLSNAHNATIDESHFHSKKMISWNGSKRAKTGLQFNTEVANCFDKALWEVEEEVKLTKILNKKLKDFGDVDVLAWHKTKNIVLAIECKDLEMAKSQSEIARQLYEFKGNVNHKGKSDRLHKHFLRVEEIKNDMLSLGKYVDKNYDAIQLIGMVVFSSLVPMHFVNEKADEIIFSSIERLPTYLNSVEL